MSGSCHIRRVEIVVELGIFLFFSIFSWTEIRSHRIQITLTDPSFFQLKIERKQRFHIRWQFHHFEYDMNRTMDISKIYETCSTWTWAGWPEGCTQVSWHMSSPRMPWMCRWIQDNPPKKNAICSIKYLEIWQKRINDW